MASTTVRLSKEAKQRLDRLQAKAVLLSGQSLTKEDVLERTIRFAEDRVADVFDDWRPPGPDSLRRLRALGFSTGTPTREEDVDRDLYGM